ncbi:MAG: PD40 domain-containing protein, partial [Thermomicrobiales bacterium]|nr:PD40 domain-containing protein [Thermomicrobiales bacterium]
MARNSTRPSFERFAAVRSYQSTLAFSPDGSEIAYSVNTSGQFNLWRQPVAGGFPRQVTLFENETVRSVAWSPDGQQFVFSADKDGDEYTAPHQVSVLGGEPTRLTNEPEVQYEVSSATYSADGRFLHYSGNDREPTEQDVIVRDLATGTERRVLAGGGLFEGGAFSPNGRYLSAFDARSNTDLVAHVIDLETGESKQVEWGEENTVNVPGPWLPDSSGFYLLSNSGREFLGAGIYDLATESFRWDITPDWDIEHLEIEGSLLVWSVNEDGRSALHARDLSTNEVVDLPEIPLGVIRTLAVAPDESSIALLLGTPTQAAEIYVIDRDELAT